MRQFLTLLFVASSALAQTPACRDAKNPTLCTDLLSIEKRDQSIRTEAMTDTQNLALITAMNKTDREDLARVEAIIAEYGLPGKSLVGAEAGELDRGKVATTIDRILIADGKPQLYGSAFKQVDGKFVPEPIQDPANLDARRKEAGLPPFAEYASRLEEFYSKPAQPKKATTIVARVWRGRVPTSRADEYAKYLYDNGPVKIRAIPGNLGAEMLRSENGDVTEFMVISYWPDRDSIKAFAGQDITKARFLPRDREFLIDPDEFVKHYDVTSAP